WRTAGPQRPQTALSSCPHELNVLKAFVSVKDGACISCAPVGSNSRQPYGISQSKYVIELQNRVFQSAYSIGVIAAATARHFPFCFTSTRVTLHCPLESGPSVAELLRTRRSVRIAVSP